MKPVLILQHQTPENLAYLAAWLNARSIPFVTVNAETDGEFPSSIAPYSALAIMGGAMSANDALITNRQAEILILQAMRLDIPVIGHCLGGQLMSRALGGVVTRSPKPEVGWQRIQYSDHPLACEWFGEDPTDTVIHWHYETFSVPEGATLLASSSACPNQAWALGRCLAMQFHIEMDEHKAAAWVRDEDPEWLAAQRAYDTVQDGAAITAGVATHLQRHQQMADAIYHRWLAITEWSANL